MLEVLVFDVLVHLRSRGFISDDECYFVYLTLEFRGLFITVVRREIKGVNYGFKIVEEGREFK